MTTPDKIKQWLMQGQEKNARWVLIVCDTLNYEDYPIYAYAPKECREKYQQYNEKDMQRVMEIYDLHQNIEEQLVRERTFDLSWVKHPI